MILSRGVQRVLVTGAGGFIGGHVVNVLKGFGFDNESKIQKPESRADLSNYFETQRLIERLKPTHVLNCAAIRPQAAGSLNAQVQSNHEIVENLVHSLQQMGNEAVFIQIGSAAEYSKNSVSITEHDDCNPSTVYGLDKLTSTLFLKEIAVESGVRSLILRPSTIYGPNQKPDMLIPAVLQAIAGGPRVPIKNPFAVRDFTHVSDLAKACYLMIENPQNHGEVFNVSSGQSMSVRTVLSKIAELAKVDVASYADFQAEPDSEFDLDRITLSSAKIESSVGWKYSMGFDRGLSEMLSL